MMASCSEYGLLRRVIPVIIRNEARAGRVPRSHDVFDSAVIFREYWILPVPDESGIHDIHSIQSVRGLLCD